MAATIDFVIPYWGDDPYRKASFNFLRDCLDTWFSDLDPPAIAHTRGSTPSRSAARNELANQGEGDIIVFIDADSIPNPDALMYSIDHVVRCKKWMYPFSTYYNLTEAGSKDFMDSPPWVTWRPEDGYEYEYVFPDPVFPGDRPAAVGGSMVIHRDAWKEVRGYDERFKGWGGEDRAMSMALMTLIGEGPRYPAPIYHLWHPAPEAERFDHPNWKSNQELLERYQAVYQGRVSMRALLDDGVPC